MKSLPHTVKPLLLASLETFYTQYLDNLKTTMQQQHRFQFLNNSINADTILIENMTNAIQTIHSITNQKKQTLIQLFERAFTGSPVKDRMSPPLAPEEINNQVQSFLSHFEEAIDQTFSIEEKLSGVWKWVGDDDDSDLESNTDSDPMSNTLSALDDITCFF